MGNLSAVLKVRVALSVREELDALAAKQDRPPSVIARRFILEGLARARQTAKETTRADRNR